MELLVGGYQAWCALLRIQLHLGKTELWCSELEGGRSVTLQLESGPLELTTRSTFRMVGIELGDNEELATSVHLDARLPEALVAGRRLAGLSLPTAIAAQMWRTAILPKALYGCEIRLVSHGQLLPLWALGKTTIPRMGPLYLNTYAAAEVLGGLPLGGHAVRDPREEALGRRLRWLQTLANHSGLLGTLHRQLACPNFEWNEPSVALRAALSSLGWQLRRNPHALCASRWPVLAPEPTYSGKICYNLTDDPAPPGAVWTDGSMGVSGGAAALQWHSDQVFQAQVPHPRSSTHCELVALNLVPRFNPCPPLVLTDSLCALQLLGGWGRRPSRAVFACSERALVRQFILQWGEGSRPPMLEKVKAHNDAAAASGDIKAMGNTAVDALAKQAASGTGSLTTTDARFEDAVLLCDTQGVPQADLSRALTATWWISRRNAGGKRRVWLDQLYPAGLEIDWPISNLLFRRPVVEAHSFVYPTPSVVLKWVARARSVALVTQLRRVHTRLAESPACLCCLAADEDDAHAVSSCSSTGAADLADLIPRLWADACGKRSFSQLPTQWIASHLLQLAVGMLPVSLRGFAPALEKWELTLVLRRFHLSLCSRLAEVLRRREQLLDQGATRTTPGGSSSAAPGRYQPSVRDLTVADLRAAEANTSSASPAPTGVNPAAPARVRDDKRKVALELNSWVKAHPHLQAVSLDHGEASVALLLLWEADHGHLFPSGTVDLIFRLRNFSAKLEDAVAADAELRAWLQHRKIRGVLSPGLRPATYTRWAVQIRPQVGEPFMSSWKAYLASMVRKQQGLEHTRDPSPPDAAPPAKRRTPAPAPTRKRARSGAPPPLHTKKARLERLQAAQAAAAAQSASSGARSSPRLGERDPVSPSAGPRALPPGLT